MTAPVSLPPRIAEHVDLDALANLQACLDLLDVLPESSSRRASLLRRAEAYLVLAEPTP